MKVKFSERIGLKTVSDTFQIDEINESLKNSLWNLFILHFYENEEDYFIRSIVKFICRQFYKEKVDELPYHRYENLEWVKTRFYAFVWYEVYDFMEFLANNIEKIKKGSSDAFCKNLNSILEEENSGYRFIKGEIIPITSELEINNISAAIDESNKRKLLGTAKHLETAIELLSLKPNPDYRNSIKESISAVESIVKKITDEKGGGLDKALNTLDSKVKFHGAFKSGLLSLYGYTSDGGIRHAILEEKEVGFDEAKFMLVSCSALVNFLISKAEKAGLKK